jgi:hypothetical protein
MQRMENMGKEWKRLWGLYGKEWKEWKRLWGLYGKEWNEWKDYAIHVA